MAYTVTQVGPYPVDEMAAALKTAWDAESVSTHHETVVSVQGGNAYAWLIFE